MINLIIGHRGTGKTHWLKIIESLKNQDKKVACFDLDQEIEKESSSSIQDIFLKGEDFFRDLEQKVFQKIIKNIDVKNDNYISVGAGFKFKKQKDWNVIFLTRPTDQAGRLFFNRPFLTDKNPFQESKDLYVERNKYYLEQCDETFCRLEHFKKAENFDKVFLGLESCPEDLFCLSLNPNNLPKEDGKLQEYLNKRISWGIRFFEIHDSTTHEEFTKQVSKILPKNKLLFSSYSNRLFCEIPDKIHWSWDLKLGKPPKGVSILSLHERGEEDLQSLLKKFSSYKNYHLKLAIEIFDFKELEMGWQWKKEDPSNRSFLPRSSKGRWRWFRNAFGLENLLHFIREGASLVLDQPFFSEAVYFSKTKKKLGAVIGDPIDFSATPSEQSLFFYKSRSIPIFPLLLKEGELTKENLNIFQKLGFVFFAVTSPLKQEAFLNADVRDEKSTLLKSANTLIFHDNQWKAYNTDFYAFQSLKKRLKNKSICVWGGGGVRDPLKEAFPDADFYSARTGELIQGEKNRNYDILIWAVGRKRMKNCLWPPKNWKVQQIIDLNYVEDSPGREYALMRDISYQAGDFIFKEQAKKQREIFLDLEQQ